MILGLVDEAVAAGARQHKVCEMLGLDPRTLQRWRTQGIGEDGRAGPKEAPGNKLSPAERRRLLEVVNSPEFRDLSPNQIVPILAERGTYVASESTIYRVLREEGQMAHREPSRAPAKRHRPEVKVATGPNQVWSWDITYLRSPIRGAFFYLYVVVDVWSRKLVGWSVHETESAEHASNMIEATCAREGVQRGQLTLHSDNGGPMKGATLLAMLQVLGVVTSFSRPRVSDDNPFSEALFRTVKYRPSFPRGAFTSIEHARQWVAEFVRWYNTEHRHSAIRYVTPAERHCGREGAILERRREVYEAARARHPERWSTGATRNWTPIHTVALNPEPFHTPARQVA
jgi:transposase InsO family protein